MSVCYDALFNVEIMSTLMNMCGQMDKETFLAVGIVILALWCAWYILKDSDEDRR